VQPVGVSKCRMEQLAATRVGASYVCNARGRRWRGIWAVHQPTAGYGMIRPDCDRRVPRCIGFVEWVPQLVVGVEKFSAGRNTDGIFDSYVAAPRRAAVY
jgi:hypothetical protein